AMSTRNDDPARASRPFDASRDGFVMGQGAAVLVLEERSRALARGARIYAEVVGHAYTNDAYHMTAPRPDGRQAARAMQLALADGDVPPTEVGYINAHGSSTPLNDPTETSAIKQVCGDHAYRLTVSGTKGYYGHALGASGAIEAAICARALGRGWLPPTMNLERAGPTCDADSVVANAAGIPLGPVGIALAHGIGMSVLVTLTMSVSGGHLNPAVSLALWLAQKIDGRKFATYVAAQLVGGIIGALLIKAFFATGVGRVTSLGTPQISGALTLFEAIAVEALLTFFLVSAVFGTTVAPDAPKVGGFGIGLAIFTCALVCGSLTGAAMNPARAFGPALVSLDWHGQIVYWIGPGVGASLAAALWKYVLLPRDVTDLA